MRTKEIISRSDLLKIGLREKLAVDFLTKLADIQASMVWNVPFSRGKQFPVLDENGDLFAYVFPFFRATENIPVKDDFHRFIAEYKEGIPGLTKKDELKRFFWREEKFISLFREKFEFLGSIYISATKENFPILKFTHAIHPLFFTRDEAYHKAEKYFKTEDVKLTNIFFFGPDGEYYEFESDDNKILMHPFTLEIIDRKEVINTIETSITIPELKEQVEFAWSEITDRLYDEPLTVPGFYKMIPDAELIPIFDQTYWSRPTAWTMALGYYDNFVPGKFPKLGYGRLIDYWYFNEETRTNIPNLIDKLLDEEIGAGMNDLERTVNSTCGYDFDIHHWTTG
ncbi:MAG: hypothetical protein KJO25_00395, partial [Bacteroidia bacterium]|nr:hypothetical protein [Bacteroidia bacterium]